MSVNAEIVDPISDGRWHDFVDRSASAGLFHHASWLRLLHRQYGYGIWACCLVRNGELLAGLPVATVRSRLSGNRLVALPFSDHVPPILGDPDENLAEPLLFALERERKRLGLSLELHAPAPLPGATTGDRFYHHTLALTGGLDRCGQAIRSAQMRNVRRAHAEGVTVTRRTDAAALDAFFHMHVLTRRRHGVPTQPRRFFLRLETLFDEGLGFVLVASCAGRPIAAAVYLQFKGVLTYKYGASDPEQLSKRANPLIYMKAIRYGCEQGCTMLDLGRTELDNDGLRRFKRAFGADERELTYSVVGGRRGVRSVSAAQQLAIRRSPPAFGRLIGAALYKHFG